MISERQVREIEDRLAGSGDQGGGDAPQPFLIPILDRIFDEGSITLDDAESTANVTSERGRIERLWKDHGGFAVFIRGLLDLIEYRRLAVKDIDSVDVWRRGPVMQDGETVMVVSALKGRPSTKFSYTARTTELRREAVQIVMASNVDRPWTAPDYKRLDKMGLQGPRHSGSGRKSSLLC